MSPNDETIVMIQTHSQYANGEAWIDLPYFARQGIGKVPTLGPFKNNMTGNCDGSRSVEEWLMRVGLGRYRIYSMVGRMWELEIVDQTTKVVKNLRRMND